MEILLLCVIASLVLILPLVIAVSIWFGISEAEAL